MNIFYLDKDPKKAAQYMFNKHVVKMILESSQILANCYTAEQLETAPKTQSGTVRKYSYYNHPCCVWTRESYANCDWLVKHAYALLEESLFRGYNLHSCFEFLDWCKNTLPLNIKNLQDFTQPALAMPVECKLDDPVESYRKYYIEYKPTDKNGKWMMYYTKRDYPDWFPQWLIEKCKYGDNNGS